MPNAELGYRVLDAINANPDHFNMGSWASSAAPVGLDDLTKEECGTTGCFAGWTAALSGYKFNGGGDVFDANGELVEVRGIEVLASQLLGLTYDQAEGLFFVEEEDIDDAVAEIFGPRPGAAS